MSTRAKALRGAVAAAVGPGKVDKVLRAVVEELEIVTAHVEDVKLLTVCTDRECPNCGRAVQAADALSALLEAAGEG